MCVSVCVCVCVYGVCSHSRSDSSIQIILYCKSHLHVCVYAAVCVHVYMQ